MAAYTTDLPVEKKKEKKSYYSHSQIIHRKSCINPLSDLITLSYHATALKGIFKTKYTSLKDHRSKNAA